MSFKFSDFTKNGNKYIGVNMKVTPSSFNKDAKDFLINMGLVIDNIKSKEMDRDNMVWKMLSESENNVRKWGVSCSFPLIGLDNYNNVNFTVYFKDVGSFNRNPFDTETSIPIDYIQIYYS